MHCFWGTGWCCITDALWLVPFMTITRSGCYTVEAPSGAPTWRLHRLWIKVLACSIACYYSMLAIAACLLLKHACFCSLLAIAACLSLQFACHFSLLLHHCLLCWIAFTFNRFISVWQPYSAKFTDFDIFLKLGQKSPMFRSEFVLRQNRYQQLLGRRFWIYKTIIFSSQFSSQ